MNLSDLDLGRDLGLRLGLLEDSLFSFSSAFMPSSLMRGEMGFVGGIIVDVDRFLSRSHPIIHGRPP